MGNGVVTTLRTSGAPVIQLDQELHRIDLCNIRSIYASRNAISKR